MVVKFTTDEGAEWQVEMTKFDYLAVHKPILDGDTGTEVCVIKEIRFNLDEGTWNFWIITDAQNQVQMESERG